MVLVIADDLTGGNATGVMMAKQGLKAYTVMSKAEDVSLASYAGVIVPTSSRGLTAEDAYAKVREVMKDFSSKEVSLCSKRIDSTLRGNIGSEVDAMRDELGEEYVALAVPAFPRAGRIQTGGSILLNGIPLHRTSVAQDPKNPVTTDRISEVLAEQSRYPAAAIFLDELARGEEFIAERIKALHKEHVCTVIIDAADDKDIELIARAALRSKVKFFSVDPGPFTAVLTAMIEKTSANGRVLAAIGSVNSIAAAQVNKLLASGKVLNVYLETTQLLENESARETEINRVAKTILEQGAGYPVCSVTAVGIIPERRVAFEPYMERLGKNAEELSAMVNSGIGEIVKRILNGSRRDENRTEFSGIFTCGGDITMAVCESLDASGIALADEVIPLASFGRLAGGEFEGIKIVTKGGMVGGDDAMQTCVNYLSR